MKSKLHPVHIGVSLCILAVLLLAANIAFGTVSIPLSEVFSAITGRGGDTVSSVIVLEKRIPEAFTAFTAGCTLAVCGLMMQTLFRNPLADPSILGISSGATLAVAIVVFCAGLLGLSSVINPLWQILAALAGSAGVLIFLLAVSKRMVGNTALLITGIMTGYLTSAVVSVLQYSGGERANFAFSNVEPGQFFPVPRPTVSSPYSQQYALQE